MLSNVPPGIQRTSARSKRSQIKWEPNPTPKADIIAANRTDLNRLAGNIKIKVTIQQNSDKAPKVWFFRKLGSQGWLPQHHGWFHAFPGIPCLWSDDS